MRPDWPIEHWRARKRSQGPVRKYVFEAIIMAESSHHKSRIEAGEGKKRARQGTGKLF